MLHPCPKVLLLNQFVSQQWAALLSFPPRSLHLLPQARSSQASYRGGHLCHRHTLPLSTQGLLTGPSASTPSAGTKRRRCLEVEALRVLILRVCGQNLLKALRHPGCPRRSSHLHPLCWLGAISFGHHHSDHSILQTRLGSDYSCSI